jgi:hypothetical protein
MQLRINLNILALLLKVQAVNLDSARQQAENRQLHISIIQEAEKFDRQEKQHYQHVKKLEDKIAELSYWKQSASDKLLASEKENASLRRKIDSLIKLTDKLTSGRHAALCQLTSVQANTFLASDHRCHGCSDHSCKDFSFLSHQ